jgi:hypothetical protein
MTINPNTNFSAGAIYTAAQANRFPRGIMQLSGSDTSENYTVEEVMLTATFTAEAGRYYKISYFEPYMYVASGTSESAMRIRDTNISGTVLQLAYVGVGSTQGNEGNVVCIKTFLAGARTVVATLAVGASTGTAARQATSLALLLVEDIGPS